jgi:hypothetical protein
VYRVQELSTTGTRLLDKSLVIRFPLGKVVQAKDTKAAQPVKPATKKSGTKK